MQRLIFCFLLAGFLLISSCQHNDPASKNADAQSKAGNPSPINFIDFKYSKVIAFATVDPYDYQELFGSKKIDLSKFHDTISKTLDSLQITALNEILSGRKGIVPDSNRVADCFMPRHNIVFLDSQNKVVNYLSICFECNRRQTSKSTSASMESLTAFFNSIQLPVFERPDWHTKYYDSVAKQKQ